MQTESQVNLQVQPQVQPQPPQSPQRPQSHPKADPKLPSNRNVSLKSSLILTFTALIWGMAFVAQRSGMQFIGPYLFMGIRMLLGALTLLITLVLIDALGRRRRAAKALRTAVEDSALDRATPLAVEAKTIVSMAADAVESAPVTSATPGSDTSTKLTQRTSSTLKPLLIAGAVCGTVLFFGGSFQQVGLVFTTASKGGFLTTLYIVLVPILALIIRHKTHWNTWISVLIAAVGLYFLCIKDSFFIEIGDIAILAGALFWAGHILVIDHFVVGLSKRDVIKLCIWQFLIAALLSLIAAVIFDRFFVQGDFDTATLVSAMPSILFTGIFSTGIAFTLQAIGQQGLNPTAASIIMSLEAVFSLIFGILLLGEVLSLREGIGCILMFTAVIISQLPIRNAPKHT